MSYWTSLLFPVIATQRLVSNLRSAIRPNPNPSYSTTVPGKNTNAILSAVMTLERRVLRHVEMPLGSSLFAVASP